MTAAGKASSADSAPDSRTWTRYTSGLQNGELIIVAGRPSMGKTSFALNIVQHVGVQLRQPVVIFSLEMSKEQLARNMLCSHARLDSHRAAAAGG